MTRRHRDSVSKRTKIIVKNLIVAPPPPKYVHILPYFCPVLRPHCYSIRLNLKKMGPLQFCLPVFLGIHRNPKQKESFNLCEGFLR